MGIAVLSGSLPPSILIDPSTRTHYYPNTTASLSVQGFTPVSMQPNTVLVRCRGAQPSGTSVVCRVYDAAGNQALVDNPSVSVDGVSNFTNLVFPIEPDIGQFPSFGLWTVELDFSHVDLCGVLLCYKPTYPMLLDNTLANPGCTSTVVIS